MSHRWPNEGAGANERPAMLFANKNVGRGALIAQLGRWVMTRA
jgi:hypothetical protein